MALKTVLLLTASFGEGHNAAARNVKEALSGRGCRVHLHDVFQDAYGPMYSLARWGYLTAINRMPGLWAWCFKMLDCSHAVSSQMGLYRAAARRLEVLLEEIRPTVVVSTFPGCNHLLDHVTKRRVARRFRTLTIITDSLTVHSSWLSAHADVFAVANHETAGELVRRGIPENKILTSGFPVPQAFEGLSRIECPAAGEPWRVLYMVNSGEHLAAEITSGILGLPEFELTVTVGKKGRLGRRLLALAAGRPLRVVGWTSEMPALMASHHFFVGKAGGAAVQECLAAGTPLILSQIVPGQEEGNARLVVHHNAGCIAKSPDAIPGILRRAISDHGLLWKEWRAGAVGIGTPESARTVASKVAEMCGLG